MRRLKSRPKYPTIRETPKLKRRDRTDDIAAKFLGQTRDVREQLRDVGSFDSEREAGSDSDSD